MNPKEMAQSLRDRAANVRRLIGDEGHHKIAGSLQQSYANLLACADLVEKVDRASEEYIARKISLGKAARNPNLVRNRELSILINRVSHKVIMKQAKELASGRDWEVIKHFAGHAGELAFALALKLSGGDLIKMAVEVAEALKEVIKTGQVLKLRKQEARMASDIYLWMDGINLAAFQWGTAAELYLAGVNGEGDIGDDRAIQRFLDRSLQFSRKWHDDPDKPKSRKKRS